MKVICIKLSSGEELIAKYKVPVSMLTETYESALFPDGQDIFDIPKKDFDCEDVRIVSLQQVGNNQIGIVFIPWAVGNPDGMLRINHEHVSAVYTATGELEKGYLSQTSEIALPGTSSGKPSLKI